MTILAFAEQASVYRIIKNYSQICYKARLFFTFPGRSPLNFTNLQRSCYIRVIVILPPINIASFMESHF